jgi:hypothetical protein
MKRYRILIFDFDSRANSFEPVQDAWDEKVKERYEENRIRAIEGMKKQFGEDCLDLKIQNFIDLVFNCVN